jgi:hypothetical protein
MKIKILRATVADGMDVFPGEIKDVKSETGILLVALKKAELCIEKTEESKPAAETATVAPVRETAAITPAKSQARTPARTKA